jgi:hypothetical protein
MNAFVCSKPWQKPSLTLLSNQLARESRSNALNEYFWTRQDVFVERKRKKAVGATATAAADASSTANEKVRDRSFDDYASELCLVFLTFLLNARSRIKVHPLPPLRTLRMPSHFPMGRHCRKLWMES